MLALPIMKFPQSKQAREKRSALINRGIVFRQALNLRLSEIPAKAIENQIASRQITTRQLPPWPVQVIKGRWQVWIRDNWHEVSDVLKSCIQCRV